MKIKQITIKKLEKKDEEIRKYEIIISIKGNKLSEKEVIELLKLKNVISVKHIKDYRTTRQNSALHKYFSLLSEELNSAGFDMKKTIKQEIDISWTPESVKQYLWLPIMKAMTGKVSTAKMNTTDIDKIYLILDKTISERTGITIPFPSLDNLTNVDYN